MWQEKTGHWLKQVPLFVDQIHPHLPPVFAGPGEEPAAHGSHGAFDAGTGPGPSLPAVKSGYTNGFPRTDSPQLSPFTNGWHKGRGTNNVILVSTSEGKYLFFVRSLNGCVCGFGLVTLAVGLKWHEPTGPKEDTTQPMGLEEGDIASPGVYGPRFAGSFGWFLKWKRTP